ncbi:MAG: HEAT repeat domain-containing protein [Pirellulales bacterium]|nr:HEAT repeat domain-containing protein [Pirellulales bacterium]
MLSRLFRLPLILTLLLNAAHSNLPNLHAQRPGDPNALGIPSTDPEDERKTFQLPPGFEVNLFAADPRLAKPIQMNWDAQGRLWVATSETYPQIQPGVPADDKILILADLDRDGVADQTTVFAGGLLIPTAVIPGDGGAYVGNSTELLHLKDTNGDGRADNTRVVLSGFGTEDTHHIIHTLRNSPAGDLCFAQSVYIHSHIETPRGVRRLNAGGFWQYHPRTQDLRVYAKGLVNPWGMAWDRWGQSFATDGAGNEGINYVFPGSIMTWADESEKIVKGLNPGSPKHCGLEVVESSNFPPEWQGNLITNDFRAQRVCRFVLGEDGAGYAAREMPELIKSSHQAFRPVDVKMGPDGALYIADWYNPIIQHGEVDFRDPRRDKTHGRIWRVTYKARPLVKYQPLTELSAAELLAKLDSPELWEREQARQLLQERGPEFSGVELAKLVENFTPQNAAQERLGLEYLWLYRAWQSPRRHLIAKLIHATDPRVRAAATRVWGEWAEDISATFVNSQGGLPVIAAALTDPHPRVRLEAYRAAIRAPQPEILNLVAAAPLTSNDRFLEFAQWKTFRDLRSLWLPRIERGENPFGENVNALVFALQAVGGGQSAAPLRALLEKGQLNPEQQAQLIQVVLTQGSPDDAGWALARGVLADTPLSIRQAVFSGLAANLSRYAQPVPGAEAALRKASDAQDPPTRIAVAQLIGAWKLPQLEETILKWSSEPLEPVPVRLAAIRALGGLGTATAKEELRKFLTSAEQYPFLRAEAAIAMGQLELPTAIELTVKQLLIQLRVSDELARVCAELQQAPGAAELWKKQLQGVNISADAARLGLRAARRLAKRDPDLEQAWQLAGGLGESRTFTPAEISAMLADLPKAGDAARGEAIYRRAELNCQKCHAIGGAGGVGGPELRSLGASAPADYILQSLIDPSGKIKEGYNALLVEDHDGKSHSGIKIRETDQELVLRNSEDQEVVLQKATLNPPQLAQTSLMPVGLIEELTRQELLDLTRFLSELGKDGPYAVGQRRLARTWQTPAPVGDTFTLLGRIGVPVVLDQSGPLTWSSVYSTVNGELPLDGLTRQKFGANQQAVAFVRTRLEVSSAGLVVLRIANPRGVALYVNGQQEALAKNAAGAGEATLDLPVGRHTVVCAIEADVRSDPLSLELLDAEKSPAQAQWVGGK